MASNINTANIDADYPVAGQDNDSQGFRDNFTNIKTGLATAKSEITALQSESPKLNANNNFNGYIIQNANLKDIAFQSPSASYTTANDTIDYSDGQYQRVIIGQSEATGKVNLAFSNFPASGQMGKLRLHITGSSSIIDDGDDLAFNFTIPSGNVYRNSADTYYDESNTKYLIDASETDIKNKVLMFDVWAVETSAGVPTSLFVEFVGKYEK